MLISVIERIISATAPSPADKVVYHSWIRKIVRHTGALPSSFFLEEVMRSSDHPVAGGGFADIYIGSYGGIRVALKVLRIYGTQNQRREAVKAVAHEAIFWKNLDHPHILPFLGISNDAFVPHLCLVSPWMSHGNIMDYIEAHPEVDRLPLLAQSASGLCYLHEHNPGLIHGDIRGANLLIDENAKVRITDFGLIGITETQALGTSFTAHTERGAVAYMAPELFGTTEVKKNRATDVYAFGITMFEAITGSQPLRGFGMGVQLVMAVCNGLRPSRPPADVSGAVSEFLWTLITLCWDANPSLRPIMHEIAALLDSELTGDLGSKWILGTR